MCSTRINDRRTSTTPRSIPVDCSQPYPGAKWCKNYSWCGHTTKHCRGIEEKDRGNKNDKNAGEGRRKCYRCGSADHVM